jgi:hypothetical protein
MSTTVIKITNGLKTLNADVRLARLAGIGYALSINCDNFKERFFKVNEYLNLNRADRNNLEEIVRLFSEARAVSFNIIKTPISVKSLGDINGDTVLGSLKDTINNNTEAFAIHATLMQSLIRDIEPDSTDVDGVNDDD